MAKGYMIVLYRTVADPATMQAYAAAALPALLSQGGHFMVRSPAQDVQTREAGLQERTVVIEFASLQQATSAYDSEAYQAAVRLLDGKVERDVRFVEELSDMPSA